MEGQGEEEAMRAGHGGAGGPRERTASDCMRVMEVQGDQEEEQLLTA